VGPHALIVFSAGLGCVVFQGILLILMQVSRESRRLVFSFQNLVLDFRDVTAMSSKGQQHMLRSVHIPTDGEKSMNCDICLVVDSVPVFVVLQSTIIALI
jgi:hypothetical protein